MTEATGINPLILNDEVENLREELIQAVQHCIQFESVEDMTTAGPGAPFGTGISDCLNWTMALGEKLGFRVKNVDGYAGHIEMGEGELIGILGHLDVVPEGDGWSFPPYGAVIDQGRIYGRGALDDKGPALAALFAMKAVENSGIPILKTIRLILGTDEESGWEDLDYYFKHEAVPVLGFAPDASFPLIHAEKGILHLELKQTGLSFPHLREIRGGERPNVVPDHCNIILRDIDPVIVTELLSTYSFPEGVSATVPVPSGQDLILSFKGLSAHGSLPENGINAVIHALKFLTFLPLSPEEHAFLVWILANPGTGFGGEGFDIAFSDQPSGKLSLNPGIFELAGNEIRLVIDIRYPVTYSEKDILPKVEEKARQAGYTVSILTHQRAHHVPKDSSLVLALLDAYTAVTGLEGYAYAIGGGTYAKALPQGVAFGPVLPGDPEVIHCPDEYISVDNLILTTKIYARAIYNLLCQEEG